MRRVAVRVSYFVRTALRGLRSSPFTSAVAILTISVSLVLVGAFTLLIHNMEDLLTRFGDELHVSAYLEGGISDDALQSLREQVATLDGVAEVRSVSQEEALERFQQGVGRGNALLEGLGENPLPASLEIVLAPDHRAPDDLRALTERVHALPGVADLASGSDWVEGYLRAVAVVRGVGWGLTVVIALATVLIVGNTIRLAVYSRRDELEILALVGAGRGFVSVPFLLEGLLQGAIGGALALSLLYAVFRVVLPGLEFGLELVLGSTPRFFTSAEASALVGAGAALGALGSGAAVARGWRR